MDQSGPQNLSEIQNLHVLVLVDHVVVVLQHWGDGLLVLWHLMTRTQFRTLVLFVE